MPHEPPTLEDILDLDDPIDRQIFKLNITVQELQSRRGGGLTTGFKSGTVLDALRRAAAGEATSRDDESFVVQSNIRGRLTNAQGFIIDPEEAIFTSFGQLRTDLLGRKALQLFPELVLPDFLKPLDLPKEDIADFASQAAADAIKDQQTFTTLFTESLTARIKDDGTGREDLVRALP